MKTSLLNAFLQQLKTAPASVLLLDYDGTLAPFHVDRSLAFLIMESISILENIAQCGRTKIIIISGRPIVELRALLTPMNDLEMWGTHGLERQLSDGSYSCVQISEEDAVPGKAQEWVVAAGLLSRAEIKLGGIAIHWRGLPCRGKSVNHSLRMAGQRWPRNQDSSCSNLRRDWSCVYRIQTRAMQSGRSLRTECAAIAYLGDDLTDEDAFRVLKGHGLTVLVRDAYRETNAEAWIRPPQELIDFLERWLINISGQSG